MLYPSKFNGDAENNRIFKPHERKVLPYLGEKN